jgi:hypothetical protein
MELYDSDDSDSYLLSQHFLDDLDVHPEMILRALMESVIDSNYPNRAHSNPPK